MEKIKVSETYEIDIINFLKKASNTTTKIEDRYIKVTPLLKSKYFGISRLSSFYGIKAVKKYIKAKAKMMNKDKELLDRIEKVFPKKTWFKKKWLEDSTPLIVVKKGRGGGTYLHYRILLRFLSIENGEKDVELFDELTRRLTYRENIGRVRGSVFIDSHPTFLPF